MPSVPIEQQIEIVKQFVKVKDIKHRGGFSHGFWDRDDLEGQIFENLTRWPPRFPGEVMRRCQFTFADWMRKNLGGDGKGVNKPTRCNTPHVELDFPLTSTLNVSEIVAGRTDVLDWDAELDPELLRHFRPRDQLILELLSEGYTMTEIAEVLEVSKVSISRSVARMRPQLSELLNLRA